MKNLKFWILGFVLLSILAACGDSGTQTNEEDIGVIPTAVYPLEVLDEVEAMPSPYVLVTDFLGREVLVPRNPQYIASIYAPTTQLVAMLGRSENIVAVANGNTRDVLFMHIFPYIEYARQPRSSGIDINMEELFADPVPDIIFLDAPNAMDPRIMDNLELFGVPVVVIEYFSIYGLKNMVTMMGEILDAGERAAAFVDYFAETIDMIQGRIATLPPDEIRVVYHAVNELLRTNITNSLVGEWMPMVGMVPATTLFSDDQIGIDRHIISLEQLLIYDPEYIIITGADVYDWIHSDRGSQTHVLQAYRYNRIYLLPMGITRWGHHNSLEAPLAMKWLAQVLHPELFYDIDIGQATREFYQNFFDYTLSDEFIEYLLGGRVFRDWRAFRNQ